MDDSYNDEDIFELQHHHLLQCLEKTTVRATDVWNDENFISNFISHFRSASSATWTITMACRIKRSELLRRHQWRVHLIRRTPQLGCFKHAAHEHAADNDIRYLEKSSKSHHDIIFAFMISKNFI
jgi:hypothetical protein